MSFDSNSESELQGRMLGALIQALELGPTALAAGSAGSRVSLIAAATAPELISHLILWWISGGPIGLMGLATYYCGDPANLVGVGGMAAVAGAPSWADQFARNPRARAAILAQDPTAFCAMMQRWALAYRPMDDSPVPGMSPADFRVLAMPVLILRNGPGDISHPRATTDWVHRLIPHSEMRDPPWGEEEWNERRRALIAGDAADLFVNWPKLVPTILDFTCRART